MHPPSPPLQWGRWGGGGSRQQGSKVFVNPGSGCPSFPCYLAPPAAWSPTPAPPPRPPSMAAMAQSTEHMPRATSGSCLATIVLPQLISVLSSGVISHPPPPSPPTQPPQVLLETDMGDSSASPMCLFLGDAIQGWTRKG